MFPMMNPATATPSMPEPPTVSDSPNVSSAMDMMISELYSLSIRLIILLIPSPITTPDPMPATIICQNWDR
ncbi:hypothetical protein BMS3Abin16_00009 [archaeon BMS3Abin16]|nr:hypothetical protein BMS3Abin16_00009 [archaeon BMS3Abin16]GBE55973.1 hypothetical protein BMS3Bbin16_00170 [archaeon BMS3Bbin16]